MGNKLSKHHYEGLAGVVRKCNDQLACSHPSISPEQRAEITELWAAQIGLYLARNNPAFDSFRFYSACLGDARFRADNAAQIGGITVAVKSPRRKSPLTRRNGHEPTDASYQ